MYKLREIYFKRGYLFWLILGIAVILLGIMLQFEGIESIKYFNARKLHGITDLSYPAFYILGSFLLLFSIKRSWLLELFGLKEKIVSDLFLSSVRFVIKRHQKFRFENHSQQTIHLSLFTTHQLKLISLTSCSHRRKGITIFHPKVYIWRPILKAE